MVKPQVDTDRRRDPHRSGQRSLSAAEGVLVALRHCSLDEAFADIVQTAKLHGVAPPGIGRCARGDRRKRCDLRLG